ncbi:MAG: ABC transporter permease [Nocardioidaceae bacterium]
MTVDQLPTVETELRPGSGDLHLVVATARVFLLRYASNPIMLLRAPLSPVLILIGFHLAYDVSGQHTVGSASAMGFLVTGMLGTGAWSSTVWGSGNAIQSEVYEGTISSVIAAPGRISAVITGHGIGSIVFGLPALLMSVIVGLGFGARFEVDSPVAAALSLLAVYVCCLCIGLAFGGLFVLTRQSNAMSNFLQAPVYLLAGFFVPRDALPSWLQTVSDALPIAHAIDALRATTLDGASLSDVGETLGAAALSSVAFLAAGLWGLHRLDDAVRRRGTLDLM